MAQPKDSQIIPNFVFRRDLNIGSAAAENDEEFLEHCFVDTGVKSLLMDHRNKKCVLVGRVGSGKSAILNRIEAEAERCVRINPSEFSLLYLDRSNIIQIVNKLGLKIEPLLEALWQHVLCVEYIKLRYKLTSPDKYKRFWNRLVQSVFADEAKKTALEYFNEWGGGDFWETTEARVTELTKKIGTQLSAKLGVDLFSKLEASGSSQNSFSDEEKIIIENQLKSVIGGSHLHRLHKVMDILSNDQNTGKPIEHFILIDDLDGRFLEGGSNYSLVAALFESIKRLRTISCLKVIICLRTDVYQGMLRAINDPAYQKDKFGDYEVTQKWGKIELEELVDRRINYLIKNKYQKENVKFADLTTGKQKNNKTILELMIGLTTYRPREIILFVNEVLLSASSRTKLSLATIKNAEQSYSRDRLASIIQEWQIFLPLAQHHLQLLNGCDSTFSMNSIDQDSLEEKCLVYIDYNSNTHDPIYAAAIEWINASRNKDKFFEKFFRLWVVTLYEWGVFGTKVDAQHETYWIHNIDTMLNPQLIGSATKIYIHPMLYQALGIRVKNRADNLIE